ncbi:MAG: chemotaxis protein CheB [Legionellales bacterium]|nr:chemotaxis protein CheB [Legionellales bacterium]|tara:strand:- start:686 stop:1258 length:573 start_codon:yes stop_codon:yes gene_type:complete
MNNTIICIGVSAGGFRALETIFSILKPMACPVLIVQHMSDDGGSYLSDHLNAIGQINVHFAQDKMPIQNGHAYIAPGGYHMLLEKNKRLTLSIDDRVSFSRPSIDVLFESVADVSGSETLGIVLTGANSDGTHGALEIRRAGGYIIAQSPNEAEASVMPHSVIKVNAANKILTLKEIADYLNQTYSIEDD